MICKSLLACQWSKLTVEGNLGESGFELKRIKGERLLDWPLLEEESGLLANEVSAQRLRRMLRGEISIGEWQDWKANRHAA